MMGGFGLMGGFGWLGMLVMILFWLGVILLVVWAVSNIAAGQRQTGEPGALEILRQRYARGEIDRNEFEQARDVLR